MKGWSVLGVREYKSAERRKMAERKRGGGLNMWWGTDGKKEMAEEKMGGSLSMLKATRTSSRHTNLPYDLPVISAASRKTRLS
ncbi:hypothetical protein E2C01_077980 [Portunus trituberculatus]|uniref:Uncharacterized protein n=1 Tax=Portunus trituberculatus TaxID=210409 RepID=A0A5B7ILG8_PORTR|nr:hypothetical protein [Portunus trituberculatus]